MLLSKAVDSPRYITHALGPGALVVISATAHPREVALFNYTAIAIANSIGQYCVDTLTDTTPRRFKIFRAVRIPRSNFLEGTTPAGRMRKIVQTFMVFLRFCRICD